jgi:RNA polymerase sigma factor (sigma-70 family)
MAVTQMNRIVEQLRHTALARSDARDGDLLDAFVARREESAFELLVRRHGPMVLGVCLRVLGNRHDAEDAFQATFLVLVRKAASVEPRELVGNWLYGVAYQTAVRARATAGKRYSRETLMNTLPEPAVEPGDPWLDLQPILDQELSRLADKYRVPIILCDLEGKTRKEAADQLGVPEGTINSRLARGRTILAQRLTNRGVTLSAGALAALLASQASAAVSAPLLTATLKTGGGIASAQVALLAEGVVKAMFLTKLGKLAAISILCLAICTGVGGLGYSSMTDAEPNQALPVGDKTPAEKKLERLAPRKKDEAARLLKEFQNNADTFELTISRMGYGSDKVDLGAITLHSSDRKLVSPVNGPNGGPQSKSARITKEQAVKIIDLLENFPVQLYRRGQDAKKPLKEEEPYIYIAAGVGTIARPGTSLHLAEKWGWHMIGFEGMLSDCVDGDARKLVHELFGAIMADPLPAKKDPVKQERAQLEGTWRLVAMESNGQKAGEKDLAESFKIKRRWLFAKEDSQRRIETPLELFFNFDADGNWTQRTEWDPAFTFYNCSGTSVIDPAKKHKSIDCTVTRSGNLHTIKNDNEEKGKIKRGIYETVDDTLRIAWAEPGADRPSDFSGRADSREYVWILERVRKSSDEDLVSSWDVTSAKGKIAKAFWLEMAENVKFTRPAKVRGVEAPSRVLIESKTGHFVVLDYVARPAESPREIDLVPPPELKLETLKGIYRIEENTLTICMAAPGQKRPMSFGMKPGEERVLLEMQIPPVIREISLKGLPVAERPNKDFGPPTVLSNSKELAKAIPDESWQETIGKQVNFDREVLLFFIWLGSSQDRLIVSEQKKAKQVVIRYEPGDASDLRTNVRLYAIAKDAAWRIDTGAPEKNPKEKKTSSVSLRIVNPTAERTGTGVIFRCEAVLKNETGKPWKTTIVYPPFSEMRLEFTDSKGKKLLAQQPYISVAPSQREFALKAGESASAKLELHSIRLPDEVTTVTARLTGPLSGQDKETFASEPVEIDVPPAKPKAASFTPLHLTGPQQGKRSSFIEEYGADPIVVVFTRELYAPLVSLMTKLSTAVQVHKNAGLHGAVVFLGEEDWLADRRLLGMTTDAKLKDTILCLDSEAGPKEYKIGKDAGVAVYFCVNKTVQARFEFAKGKLTETDVTKLLDELPKFLPADKPKPGDKGKRPAPVQTYVGPTMSYLIEANKRTPLQEVDLAKIKGPVTIEFTGGWTRNDPTIGIRPSRIVFLLPAWHNPLMTFVFRPESGMDPKQFVGQRLQVTGTPTKNFTSYEFIVSKRENVQQLGVDQGWETSVEELKKLEGEWKTKDGTQLFIRAPHVVDDKGYPLATLFLDPTKKPKELNSIIDKQVRKGIYEVKDDVLTIGLSLDGYRPKEFPKEDSSSLRLMIYRRVSTTVPGPSDLHNLKYGWEYYQP